MLNLVSLEYQIRITYSHYTVAFLNITLIILLNFYETDS